MFSRTSLFTVTLFLDLRRHSSFVNNVGLNEISRTTVQHLTPADVSPFL